MNHKINIMLMEKCLNVILKTNSFRLNSKFLNKNDSSEFNIAVAVNDVLIEKYRWKKKKICVDDKIEIVAPFFLEVKIC